VLSYAAYFAVKTQATVKILYVIDYLLAPPSYLTVYIEEEKRREESELSGWKKRLRSIDIDTECAIVLGRLYESFAKAIEEICPELLVLGFRCHLLHPSSSERLIRSLKVPILVVKGKAAESSTIGSVKISDILCPVDFSDNSIKALSAAKGYAAFFGSKLHPVHVIPTYIIKEKWIVWKRLGEDERKKFDASMTADAESRLQSLCREFGTDRGEVFQGNPSEIIASLASDRNYDLIVMGGRGLSYVQSVLIGSTTDAVIKSSPCPVLIVH
jgi:nucleotide-binding universal stress UspA family protein